MPLIGFTVMKEEILSGEKRQTIRKPWKRQIKVGDKLYLYWHLRQKDCELLKVTKCVFTARVRWSLIRDHKGIARLDGFKDSAEMREWFEKKYKPKPDDLFDIIRW